MNWRRAQLIWVFVRMSLFAWVCGCVCGGGGRQGFSLSLRPFRVARRPVLARQASVVSPLPPVALFANEEGSALECRARAAAFVPALCGTTMAHLASSWQTRVFLQLLPCRVSQRVGHRKTRHRRCTTARVPIRLTASRTKGRKACDSAYNGRCSAERQRSEGPAQCREESAWPPLPTLATVRRLLCVLLADHRGSHAFGARGSTAAREQCALACMELFLLFFPVL